MIPATSGIQVQALLFDFDGTLIDASEAICSSFRAALGSPRGAQTPDALIRNMIGRPLRAMFADVHDGATSAEIDAYVERYREAFLPSSMAMSRPLPGVAETIRTLSNTYRLAIVTTRQSDGAVRMLQVHKLLTFFETIVGLEHVQAPKPDPEPVREALRRMQVAPAHAWMIGDTPDDVLAGRRAGVRTIGVTTGCHDTAALRMAGADAVLEDISALAGLLAAGLRSSDAM